MFVIDQLDVTIFIPLFSLYMFRTILVHHQSLHSDSAVQGLTL
jgi:hypothetical protein